QVYSDQTMPLKKFYEEKEILVSVDAHLSDNAFQEIMKSIEGKDK
ncbi:MAG: adenylate kinase, partial [Candidatus Bathyarchaeota archaeon]|nr:adenylate kinase [Candidatus Bathyarchaeota archaeon]